MVDCIPIMRAKQMQAIHALLEDGYDFAYVHVEAPDEMGHRVL